MKTLFMKMIQPCVGPGKRVSLALGLGEDKYGCPERHSVDRALLLICVLFCFALLPPQYEGIELNT